MRPLPSRSVLPRQPARRRVLAALVPILVSLVPGAVLSAPAAPAAKPSPSKPPATDVRGKGGDADVMARVNGRPILRREFDLAVQIQFRGRRRAVGLKELQVVRDQVLERLIENELLYQKASGGQPAIPDKDVDAEFGRIQTSFPSADAFAAALTESGVTEGEFKSQLRRTLLVTRFVEHDVVGDVKVSDEEVRRYYDQNPEEMKRKEAVHLAQILVRTGPGASGSERTEARQKIEAVLAELRGGGDFATLARRHSDGPEAARGGDTGWMARGAGPPPIESVAFALEPNPISDVVETRLGFQVLKLIEKRPAGAFPFEQAQKSIRARLEAK